MRTYTHTRYSWCFIIKLHSEDPTSKTNYEIGANYWIGKSIMIAAEYVRVNDRSLNKPNYNMFDLEFDVKF